MDETPIYTSESTVKSIWQEYRVYNDRLEFDSLFGRMTIPFDQIERVEICPSDLGELLRGELHLKGFRPALKLDWANFLEHVVLESRRAVAAVIIARISRSPERKWRCS